MRKFLFGLFALAAVLGLSSCAGVQRVDSNTVTDLSGNWNDTDARLTAEEMISDCLTRPWLADFINAHGGKKPTVIVGTVVNRTDEHLSTEIITKDMERILTNSGKVTFVSSREERDEVRAEREDQQMNASAETLKKMRNEKGADYMLKGYVNSIADIKGGSKAKFWQIDMELVNMEDNSKVWMDSKEIKKVIKKGMFGG
jgi:penicillin-binding protein activator